MGIYVKADKKSEMETASFSNLPKNAKKWATLFSKNDPEFSYRLVRT